MSPEFGLSLNQIILAEVLHKVKKKKRFIKPEIKMVFKRKSNENAKSHQMMLNKKAFCQKKKEEIF